MFGINNCFCLGFDKRCCDYRRTSSGVFVSVPALECFRAGRMQFLGSGVLKYFGGVVIWWYVRVSGIAALGMTECPALRHWECQGVRHCSTMGILNAKGTGIGNARMLGIGALGMSGCPALRHRINVLRFHK